MNIINCKSMINDISQFIERETINGFNQVITAHSVPLDWFKEIYEYMESDARFKKESLRFVIREDERLKETLYYFSTTFCDVGNKNYSHRKEVTLFSVFDYDAKEKQYDLWLKASKY